MPILRDAPDEEVERLLELYPAALLKDAFPDAGDGSKKSRCQAVAAARDVTAISTFLQDSLSACKQHVYVFDPEREGYPELPGSIDDGERVVNGDPRRALYVVRSTVTVFLQNPLEQTSISFLWPFRIETSRSRTVVRFVMLEKNIPAYFDKDRRAVQAPNSGKSEDDVIRSLGVPLTRQDIHRGVKAAWKEPTVDAFQVRYRTDDSAEWVSMYSHRGIRRYRPALFRKLLEVPLGVSIFIAEDEELKIGTFAVDPGQGTISFMQFSGAGDSDRVLRDLLKGN